MTTLPATRFGASLYRFFLGVLQQTTLHKVLKKCCKSATSATPFDNQSATCGRSVAEVAENGRFNRLLTRN
jgi:hypothetical protein